MGILRVYLALCVVIGHSGRALAWPLHPAPDAVQIFFVISGFYMAMILSSGRYGGAKNFYLSRFLRIFLPYWLVLAAVVGWSLLTGLCWHDWLTLQAFTEDPLQKNGAAGFWLATFSNLTLFGQDWVMFLSQDAGRPLSFTTNFWSDPHPLWHYLAISQCWSVGVEVTFYAFAPYLNRLASRWLLLIVVAASTARIFTYYQLGLSGDPWNYRFLPFEIALFVSGMLGYRLYARTKDLYPLGLKVKSHLAYAVGAVVLLVLFRVHLSLGNHVHFLRPEMVRYGCNGLLAAVLPVLFFAFGNNAIDRFIGELSYPIYLTHLTVIGTLHLFLPPFGWNSPLLFAFASAAGSVLLAVPLTVFFITPLDRWRHLLTVPSAGKKREPLS